MASNALQEWLSLTGVELHHDIEPDRFEDFLIELSSDRTIPVVDLIATLIALRVPENQVHIIKELAFDRSLRPCAELDDENLMSNWIVANICLHIELNTSYRALLPSDPEITKSERYFVDTLVNQQLLGCHIYDIDELNLLDKETQFQLLDFLITLITTTLSAGALRTTTVICHIAQRALSVIPAAKSVASLLLYPWAKSLHRLCEYERSVEIYNQCMSMPLETSTAQDLFCRISLYLDFLFLCVDIDAFDEYAVLMFEQIKTELSLDSGKGFNDEFCRNIFGDLGNQILGNFYTLKLVVDRFEKGTANGIDFIKADQFLSQAIKSTAAPDLYPVFWLKNLGLVLRTAQQFDAITPKLEDTLNKMPKRYVKCKRVDVMLTSIRYELSAKEIALNLFIPRDKISTTDTRKHIACLLSLKSYFPKSTMNEALALSYLVLGRELAVQNYYEEACKQLDRCNSLLESLENPNNLAYAIYFASACLARSRCLIMIDKLVDARDDANLCLNLAQVEPVKKTHRAFEISYGAHASLMLIDIREGMTDSAISHFHLARESLFSDASVDQWSRNREIFHFFYQSLPAFLADTESNTTLRQLSAYMSQALDRTPDFSDLKYKLYGTFLFFHYRWLIHDLKTTAISTPDIIWILHARKLRLRMQGTSFEAANRPKQDDGQLMSFSALQFNDTISREFADFKDTFKADLTAHVKSLLSGERSSNDFQSSSEDDALRMQNKILDYNQSLNEVSLNQLFNASSSSSESSVIERLRYELLHDEALLLSIDPFLDDSALKTAGETDLPEYRQFVWLVTKKDAPRVIELDIDLQSIAGFIYECGERSIDGQVRSGAPTYYCHGETVDKMDWAALEELIHTQFWLPVLDCLPTHVRALSIVSQGRFHVFPYSIGVPSGEYEIRKYLSIEQFGAQNKNIYCNGYGKNAGLRNPDPSLVLASREGVPLLNMIWDQAGRNELAIKQVSDMSSTDNYHCLHLSGHGKRRPDRHRRSHELCMVLADGGEIDNTFIYKNFGCIDYVWLSSCVLGYCEDDFDGDPTGLIAPLFVSGTSKVIASLTNLPDLWAPLLVALTEWHYSVDGFALDESLEKAKSSLSRLHDLPELKVFLSVYRAWIDYVLEDWFQDLWAVDTGTPWLDGNNENYEMFIAHLLEYALPDLGVKMSEEKIESVMTLPYGKSQFEQLHQCVFEASTSPPPEVINVLSHCVVVFSSGAKV